MYKIVSVLLLLSALAAPALSQRKKAVKAEPRAYTVKGDAPAKSPAASFTAPRIGITVERYTSSYDIREDGTARQTFEVQQKCEFESCLGRVKNLKQEFNGETHNIRLLEAAIIKAGGKTIVLPLTAGKVLPTPQAEAAPGFSSMKQFELEFPDVAAGDSVRYKIVLETIRPIFGKGFDSLERFPLLYDWRSIEVNVSAPAGYALHFDTPGLQGGPVAAEPGRARWSWKAADLKAFDPEAVMVDPISRSPRFIVTSLSSFNELGDFFGAGVREKAVITPEVQKLADEITAGLKSPEEQAAAIYQWVNKNIRYLLVVLDRGGWVPHSTTEILKNGYGDCKDYTTLIHALLKAKGIDSTPVLINADFGTWFPKVPTMSYFNHAILYVPSLKLFADATAPNTRLGIIPAQLVGKTGLLSSEKSALIELPKNDPDSNQVTSDIEIELAENGDLKAISKNTIAGRTEMAVRPLFANYTRYVPADSLVKVILAFYGINGTGRVLSISDPHAVSEPFVLSMEVNVPDYTTLGPKGSVTLPVGMNMNSMSVYEMFTKEEKRNTDLIVGAARLRERYLLKLPASAAFAELPAAVKFSNAAGQLTSTYSRVDGGVELVRELVIAKDTYTPAEYPLFKELIRQTVESLNSSVAYTSDPKLFKSKPAARRPAAKPAKTGMEAALSALLPGLDDGKLTAAQARKLEAKVIAEPDDTESRIRLLRHYMSYDVRETPALVRARTVHRLWFIRNRPEMSATAVYGFFGRSDADQSSEYAALRDEWIKQIEVNKAKKAIRLNAFEFVKDLEPALAKQLMKDGMAADAGAYEYPFQLARIARTELDDLNKKLTADERAALNREVLGLGRTALALITKERSEERDTNRGELTINMCRAALDTGDLAFAEVLGRDLVVEFGSEIGDSAYSQAAHIGNIALGMAELSRGKTAKAAEHLLTSIRAPLRKSEGHFTGIDFRLAKELFRKGEHKAVIEFLKQNLDLESFKEEPEVYKTRIDAIRTWISQAEKGIEPSFDFEKTAAKK